jgi:cupin fold WbuC family metalloprotein
MKKLFGAKTTTFIQKDNIITVNKTILNKLKDAANKDPLKRSRLCLHHDFNDQVQEMIIAIKKGVYIRPHRHSNKTESLHIIEGKLLIIFFDDSGKVKSKITLALSSKSSNPFIYRIACPIWHSAIPLTKFVLYHETINGPFSSVNSEFASWSPEERDTSKINQFIKSIK